MNMKSLFNTNQKRLTVSLVAAGVFAVPMLVGNTYTHNLMPISSAHAASEQGQGGQGAGGAMKGQGGIGGAGGVSGGQQSLDVNDVLRGKGTGGRDAGITGRPDDKGPPEGDGPTGDMGGGNPNAGTTKGDLYGDLYVVLRDPLTGAPILDDEGRLQFLDVDGNVIAYASDDPEDEGYTEVVDETLLQEVSFDRLNLARSPDAVLSHSLDTALETIALDADGVLEFDAAGRVVIVDADGVVYTIDSPLENLALYQDAIARLNDDIDGNETFTLDQTDALFAAAASKFGEVTLDMVVYLNTILGLNTVTDAGTTDYVDLTSFTYDRTDAYTNPDGTPVEVTYLSDPEGDGTYVTVTESLLDAVFDGETATADGATGYALSTDDALQVIEFIHEPIH
ncbi:hypothetical protein [Guyparkeria sp. TX1]|uniref:hypothetical protein n=1 Tax=Guyparkeria sp. TX1 TaxID=3115001 RepID=UPI003977698C